MSAMTPETRETLALMLTNNIVVLDTYPQGHPGRLAYEAIVAALRDVLTPRVCGTCRHDGVCGIQASCVSSMFPDRRPTGCDGGWQAREGEGGGK